MGVRRGERVDDFPVLICFLLSGLISLPYCSTLILPCPITSFTIIGARCNPDDAEQSIGHVFHDCSMPTFHPFHFGMAADVDAGRPVGNDRLWYAGSVHDESRQIRARFGNCAAVEGRALVTKQKPLFCDEDNQARRQELLQCPIIDRALARLRRAAEMRYTRTRMVLGLLVAFIHPYPMVFLPASLEPYAVCEVRLVIHIREVRDTELGVSIPLEHGVE